MGKWCEGHMCHLLGERTVTTTLKKKNHNFFWCCVFPNVEVFKRSSAVRTPVFLNFSLNA